MNPATHLAIAADSVRDFNHSSRSTSDGWQYPGNAYDALGNLSRLVGMLPQALEQSVVPVSATHSAGRLVIDGGGDPDAALRYLRDALAKAVQAAAELTEAVHRMHNESSPMGLDIRGLPEFEDDEPHRG
ncbi:hypothetical protein [Streptomyces lydicamycinicus]|uniref:hypothetical protein n=1 Tax=Streptomyces lydicamycinicus TaxID=1546107 RepID=UPI003C306AC2